DQPRVRELALRVLVQRSHVGVRRRGIEVVVALLHVLSVVAFVPGETEQALFENRILAVPQREPEAEAALAIGDSQQPVFAPAVGPAARVVVRQRFPGVAAGRVILAHRAPLAFGEIRAPPLPVLFAAGVFAQAGPFGTLLAAGRHRHSSRPGYAA